MARKLARFAFFGTTPRGVRLISNEDGRTYTLKGNDFHRLLGCMIHHMDKGDFEVMRGFLMMYDAGNLRPKRRH